MEEKKSPNPGASEPLAPIAWAGQAESLVADMRNRDIYCVGERSGFNAVGVTRAFVLSGWRAQSVVDVLLSKAGGSSQLVEVDPTFVSPVAGFDLADGKGVGSVRLALQEILLSPRSTLARAAAVNAGFHTHPFWFEELYRVVGGGNPIWTTRVRVDPGQRDLVNGNTHWKRGARASAVTFAHDEKVGGRPQITGFRVLDQDLRACPECGAPMVKTAQGAICSNEQRKRNLPPAPNNAQPSQNDMNILAMIASAVASLEDDKPTHG